ncbi:MAG: RNA methyltransferase [Cytophagales bacterium]|nr:RNA methyltransferase [Cytophagales bacterium]MDW8383673.1 RNA methyltransferase [Flammeovirgaceae bacterium]
MSNKFRKLSIEELGRKSVEEARSSEKYPVCLVLENIRSMHNVGSIFRTADALNVREIVLCGITARPPHREINKTALGATESVAWKYFTHTAEAFTYLQQQDYYIVGIEQTTHAIALHHFEFTTRPYAFVFGNEIEGIQQETLNACEDVIEIPQFGIKHSFNVSITAAIVLWEYVRKRHLF